MKPEDIMIEIHITSYRDGSVTVSSSNKEEVTAEAVVCLGMLEVAKQLFLGILKPTPEKT